MFFDYKCIKAALCCFPRVYSWFFPDTDFRYLTHYAESVGGDAGHYFGAAHRAVPHVSGLCTLPLVGQSDWIFLCSCHRRSFGIRADGSLWGWGFDLLGNGSTVGSAVPIFIDAGPWKHISTSDTHTLGIKSDGTLWAWGSNYHGQIGNGRYGQAPPFYNPWNITLRAKLSSSVSEVTLTNGGQYLETPSVSFVVQNKETLNYTLLNSIGLLNDATNIDAEGASGAAGEAVMDWQYVSSTITNAGSGYKNFPAVVVDYEGDVESPLRLYATVSFSVINVAVANGGRNYTSPPTVFAFSGDGTPGTGFSCEAIVTNGVVSAVSLISGGSGYKFSRYVDGNASTVPFSVDVGVSGGGGSNARITLFFGDGVVTAVSPVQSGITPKGYLTKPTLRLVGGGGTGATVSAVFHGSVTKVNVTNGGSGYSRGTSRYINVAFTRQSGDTLTQTAGGWANITPVEVTSIDKAAQIMQHPFFDGRKAKVSAFPKQRTYSFFTDTTSEAQPCKVEAKIVGGGLTWEDGITVDAEVRSPTTTFDWYYWPNGSKYSYTSYDFSLSFQGSEREFKQRPRIVVRAQVDRPSPRDNTISVRTIAVKDGLDAYAQTEAIYADTKFENGAQKDLGGTSCENTYQTWWVTETQTHDPLEFYNKFTRRLIEEGFTGSGYFPKGEYGSHDDWNNFTGSPSVSATEGNAEISLLANVDGQCTWIVDKPGDDYRKATLVIGTQKQSAAWCESSGKSASGQYTLEQTRVSVKENALITLSPQPRSPFVTFYEFPVPDASWSGNSLADGFAYASFGGTDGQAAGCWKLERSGNTKLLAGGLFSFEPTISFQPDSVPLPTEIKVTDKLWKHASADGNLNNLQDRVIVGPYYSQAVTTSGEVFTWGNTFGYEQQAVPETMGRPAVVSCEWNLDKVVGPASSFSVAADRFFVFDKPQYSIGTSLSAIQSSRACEEPKQFADNVPKSQFGVVSAYSNSSDEKDFNYTGQYRGPKPFINKLTTEPSTRFAPGSGYTTVPKIEFLKKGDPILNVTTSLKTVPPFDSTLEGFAKTSTGELWSLHGGVEMQGSIPKLVARKIDFSAENILDSWVGIYNYQWSGWYYIPNSHVGVRHLDIPESLKRLSHGKNLSSVSKAGPPIVNGFFSKANAPITHTTVESLNVVYGYAIVLDDGGRGFDDYSSWNLTVTPPAYLTVEDERAKTTLTGSVTLDPYFREHDYKAAVAQGEAQTKAGLNPQPSKVSDFMSLAMGLFQSITYWTKSKAATSVVYEKAQTIKRATVTSPTLSIPMKPWRGSLIPQPYPFSNRFNYYSGNGVAIIEGVFDATTPPEVKIVNVSGSSTYTSPPSWRIVPITGFLQQTTGQTKCDGTWSDYNIESGSRKLLRTAFPGYKGFSAPQDEQGFVKTNGKVGLKADGSLWILGVPNVSPSTVMANLELKVTNKGSGYRHPVTAELSPQLSGVATASATLNGKVVALGVDDGGSGYRSPPTLSISGGATAEAVISGPVESAEVQGGGSGYRNPPRVRFSYPGISAFAAATMSGSVESVSLSSGGSGYTQAPTVSFGGSGEGASATATIKGVVAEVFVDSPGSGYSSAPSVAFSGGGGSGATAVALLAGSGPTYSISAIKVTSPGSGYTSAPTVQITGGEGSGATGVATIDAAVFSIQLTSGGTKYSDHPTVSFSGNSKEQAIATSLATMSVSTLAIQSGGKYRSAPTATFEAVGEVSAVSLGSGGDKYSSAPEVRIVGGVGKNAKASCTISAKVTEIKVVNGGSGYSSESPPRVELVGGYDVASGTQAKAEVSISGGAIQSVSVTSQGDGYTAAPNVRLIYGEGAILEPVVSNGAIQSVRVVCGGFGYAGSPKVAFIGGRDASATCSINSSGCITSVSVMSGGSGYSATAKAQVSSPTTGKGSAISAVISGPVNKLTLEACGSGYDVDAMPSVIFIGGGGSGASATVTVSKSGSGGSATSKINGSVIYAKITSQGSGYQTDPTVTVSGGGNELVAELKSQLSSGLITQEDYDEAKVGVEASLRAAISGNAMDTTVSVTNGGENYLGGGRAVISRNTHEWCDAHGKRVSGGATLRGLGHGGRGEFTAAGTGVSTQDGGGGSVVSVTPGGSIFNSGLEFTRKPTVHFANTVGVSVETRLKVCSMGIRSGSPLETSTFGPTRPFNEPALNIYNYYSSIFGANSFVAYIGSSGSQARVVSTTNSDGMTNFPQAPCNGYFRWKDIVVTRLRADYDGNSRAIVPWKRKPTVVIEAELGSGASADIRLNSNKVMTDFDYGPSQFPRINVIGTNSGYSSDAVGRVIDPGIVEFIPPEVTLTVQDGKVVSGSVVSIGNLASFSYASSFYLVDYVVHDGGGTGATIRAEIYPTDPQRSYITVLEQGSGYTSQPRVMAVPIANPVIAYRPIYGFEHQKEPKDWATWSCDDYTSMRCEYVNGNSGDGYITVRDSIPTSDGGLWPFFDDGFVSNAKLTDGGFLTHGFLGPAFVKHFTSNPTVTLSSGGETESALIEAKVVRWTSIFSGTGDKVAAVRDENP